MLKEYLRLVRYVKVHWKFLFVGLVFLLIASASNGVSYSAVVPLLDCIFAQRKVILPKHLPDWLAARLSGLVEALNSRPPEQLLIPLLLFIIGMIFLRAVSSYLQNVCLKRFGIGILAGIRSRLYEKIVHLPYTFFTRERSGAITTRITYDVNTLLYALSEGFWQFILRFCELVVYAFIIFSIDWKLSIVAIVIFPPLLVPVLRIGQKMRKLSRAQQESYAQIGNAIQETVYGQQVIKAFNLQEMLTRRFNLTNMLVFRTEMALVRRLSLIMPMTDILAAAGVSGIVYWGSLKVLRGEMSAGFFFLFLLGVISLISPLKTVGTMYAILKQASAALPRIFELLEMPAPTDARDRPALTDIHRSIEFRNVSFCFEKRPVLSHVSFCVRVGEKIGIAGATGAGKTTLINLLLRFYDPDEGAILIDGRDIREFSVSTLRTRIGLVSQEPVIFHDTVRRNISLEEHDSIEQVRRAACIAQADRFIEDLPDGYETIIGERGLTLSGGQKQLLMIARAIYRNPALLILDEASASLDATSEKQVQEALQRVMAGRTVFIIAHRLSALRATDRIIVLQNGTVAEEGVHAALVERNGVYARLWRTQVAA